MTMAAATLSLPDSIYRKLAAVRRRVYLWLALHGMAHFVLVLAAMISLSLALDWELRLDRISRAVLLIGAIATLVTLLARCLIWPLLGRLTDEALALRIERQNPRLGQGLISALQFVHMATPDPRLTSPQLLHAAIDQGIRAVAGADFNHVLDRRFRRHAALAAIAAIGALAVLSGAFTVDVLANHSYFLRAWYRRNILLTDDRWRPRFELCLLPLDDPHMRLTRGDDYQQKVKVTKGSAGRLFLRIRFGSIDPRGEFHPDSQAAITDDLSRIGDAGNQEYTAEVRDPMRSFQVCADGGEDSVTAWRTIRMVERPRIESVDLTCRRPDYTQPDPARRIDRFALDNGIYETVRGSTLSFDGLCSKPLGGVQVQCADNPVAAIELVPDPLPGPATASDAPATSHRFRGTIDARNLITGVYSFKIVDTDGVEPADRTELKITVVPDRAPEVRAEEVGIGPLVTTRAVIPLHCSFADDYGVVSAALTYKRALRSAVQMAWSAPIALPITDDALMKQLPSTSAQCRYRFNLGPLKLKPGAALAFQIQARDNCPPPDGPNLGISAEYTVAVVSDEELRRELLRREQDQRAQFERLYHDQQRLQTDVQGVLDRLGRNAHVTAPDLDLLTAAQRRQRQIGDSCTFIAGRFAQLLAEMLNNDLEHPDDPAPHRLQESIIDPLGVLAGQWVPAAAGGLDTAHRGAADDGLRRRAVTAAIDTQERILHLMERTLSAMQKYESYQQAVIELRRVLGDTEQAATQIQQEARRLLLGGDSNPSSDQPGNP